MFGYASEDALRARRGLRQMFDRNPPPLAFIGGHEHSLQIFRAVEPDEEPTYSIVSGSAAKLPGVSNEEGLLFARSAPGYMRLIVEKDGDMSLFVEAAPDRFQSCPKEGPESATCMAEGVAAFETSTRSGSAEEANT